ncbi:MAG: DMT family transporter [Betaproteobacteria bacterium]|nr:DMT family transporter [Betaproteobacteria bacterium]
MSDTSASASTPALTARFFRWGLAFLLLLPIAYKVLQRNSALWSKWKRFAVLGFLGVGCYNSFQYLALQTSSPINVTLVASSTPVFMLAIGAVFFNQTIRWQQVIGAVLSIAGVLLVLGRGDWNTLANVQLVIGDIYVLIATACWGFYSWLLTRPDDPSEIRGNWAYFLMAQMVFGLSWSGLFTTGEWLAGDAYVHWSWPLAAALAYVALCPSLLAYRCWGLGVQQAGPNIAGFFANLTPLFAAVMSALVLGDLPQTFHAAAFALIVGGIVVSSRR